MSAALPPDEQWRLDVLRSYSVLDAGEAAELDAIVAEVSEELDMPIAMLSLTGVRRHWVKARFGIDTRVFPREVSICAHTILNGDLLTIEYTRSDARSADNPFVVGAPFLRFYAGIPLTSKLGPNLGTLCVLDTITRTLTEAHASLLRRAATKAMTVLSARRLEKALTYVPGMYQALL